MAQPDRATEYESEKRGFSQSIDRSGNPFLIAYLSPFWNIAEYHWKSIIHQKSPDIFTNIKWWRTNPTPIKPLYLESYWFEIWNAASGTDSQITCTSGVLSISWQRWWLRGLPSGTLGRATSTPAQRRDIIKGGWWGLANMTMTNTITYDDLNSPWLPCPMN